jgi:hypothetical protein
MPHLAMYDLYIVRRTQIYLEEAQDFGLAKRAAAEEVTKSELIRRAIDAFLHQDEDQALQLARFRTAVNEAAGIAPYLPEGHRYVKEIRQADLERQRRLEKRLRE